MTKRRPEERSEGAATRDRLDLPWERARTPRDGDGRSRTGTVVRSFLAGAAALTAAGHDSEVAARTVVACPDPVTDAAGLADCIVEANLGSVATINIDSSGGSIPLIDPLPLIDIGNANSLVIQGQDGNGVDHDVISGTGTLRHFFVRSGTVTFRDLQLEGGFGRGGEGAGGGGGGLGAGGALFVYDGDVTVERILFLGNAATGGVPGTGSSGGGGGGGLSSGSENGNGGGYGSSGGGGGGFNGAGGEGGPSGGGGGGALYLGGDGGDQENGGPRGGGGGGSTGPGQYAMEGGAGGPDVGGGGAMGEGGSAASDGEAGYSGGPGNTGGGAGGLGGVGDSLSGADGGNGGGGGNGGDLGGGGGAGSGGRGSALIADDTTTGGEGGTGAAGGSGGFAAGGGGGGAGGAGGYAGANEGNPAYGGDGGTGGAGGSGGFGGGGGGGASGGSGANARGSAGGGDGGDGADGGNGGDGGFGGGGGAGNRGGFAGSYTLNELGTAPESMRAPLGDRAPGGVGGATTGAPGNGGLGGFGAGGGGGGLYSGEYGTHGAGGYGAGDGHGGSGVTRGGGGAGFGGAVFVRSGSVAFIANTFEENVAAGFDDEVGGGEVGEGLGKGGAIFALHTTTNTNGNDQGMPGSLPTISGCGNVFGTEEPGENANQAGDALASDTDNPDTFGTSRSALEVACDPEIEVQGNGDEIVDGDATPSTLDHTDFGAVPTGVDQDRTFTIRNTGDGDLNLTGGPLVALLTDTVFSVQTQPALSTIPPGGSTSFVVRFNSASVGVFNDTVSIDNDDADENPYTFAIRAEAIPATPEIRVTGNGIEIPDGDATPQGADGTDFGSVNDGSSAGQSFVVHNDGSATLNLTATPEVQISGPGADSFEVTSQPALIAGPVAQAARPGTRPGNAARPVGVGAAATTVGATSSKSFTITFEPAGASGQQNATVTIPNDDADEAPYDFAITGFGNTAPQPIPPPGGPVPVADDVAANTIVATVTVTDSEANETPNFQILGADPALPMGTFTIDPNTGDITLVDPLALTPDTVYELTVQVEDDGGLLGQTVVPIAFAVVAESIPTLGGVAQWLLGGLLGLLGWLGIRRRL